MARRAWGLEANKSRAHKAAASTSEALSGYEYTCTGWSCNWWLPSTAQISTPWDCNTVCNCCSSGLYRENPANASCLGHCMAAMHRGNDSISARLRLWLSTQPFCWQVFSKSFCHRRNWRDSSVKYCGCGCTSQTTASSCACIAVLAKADTSNRYCACSPRFCRITCSHTMRSCAVLSTTDCSVGASASPRNKICSCNWSNHWLTVSACKVRHCDCPWQTMPRLCCWRKAVDSRTVAHNTTVRSGSRQSASGRGFMG